MQPSDEQLVRACQRGDEDAWEQLITRYRRLVYTIPRRAGLDDDLAAEVFQRVFITLLESIDRIEQPARISTWLVTTARRETWRTGKELTRLSCARRGISASDAEIRWSETANAKNALTDNSFHVSLATMYFGAAAAHYCRAQYLHSSHADGGS